MRRFRWQTGLDDIQSIAGFLASRRRLLVLTGAGCSTASGIGDYRDASGAWKRAMPIQHADFMRCAAVRQRYWARSFHGWPSFSAARPNAAHAALAAIEPMGVITQNVDRLHQRAGSDRVIDLHGRLDQVICMTCGTLSLRHELQSRLAQCNPWLGSARFATAPDGDADVQMTDDALAEVVVPDCLACGGVLKPHVVFYGDNVPKARVDAAYAWVDRCDGLLVVGSSLMVFSGLRFCRRAAKLGVPMALVNRGRTRADALFDLRLDGACETILPELAGAL